MEDASREDVLEFARRLCGIFLAVLPAHMDREQELANDGRERLSPTHASPLGQGRSYP